MGRYAIGPPQGSTPRERLPMGHRPPNLSWDGDAYRKGLAELIRNFVAARGDVPAEELGNWLDEFPELNQSGRYLSAVIATFSPY